MAINNKYACDNALERFTLTHSCVKEFKLLN
jgi:hypothetical protein